MLALVRVRSVGGVLVLVPEEVLTLSELLLLRLGGEDGLEGVGIETGVVHLGGSGHGGWGEVLHLFEFVPHLLGEVGELRHVLIAAPGMGGDEVRDELLAQAFLLIDAVEDALEVVEEAEGGFAHVLEHGIGGVLGGYLEASADMARDEFAGVLACSLIALLVFAVVEEQVVAYS